MRKPIFILTVSLLLPVLGNCGATERILDGKLHHLRIEGEREWAQFPEVAEAAELAVHFSAKQNTTEY